MSQSIHGHEVMHMMLEAGTQFSKATLKQAIESRFGADAKFHTCSAAEMNAEQLIEFLAGKGKFIASDDGFNTTAEKICNH